MLADEPVTGLYLWVLEPNRAAQAFYTRLGGVLRDEEPFDTPGGGRAVGIRVLWPDRSVLLSGPAS